VNKAIELLKAELLERQRELVQGKEYTSAVRTDLEKSHEVNAQVLQSLVSQIAQVLESVEAQRVREEDSVQFCKTLDCKVNSLSLLFEEIKAQVARSTSIAEKIVSTSENMTKDFTTEAQILGSRLSDINMSLQRKDSGVEEVIKMCHTIDERLKCEDGNQYWQQRCREADQLLHATKGDLRESQANADQALSFNQEFSEENTTLHKQVTLLEQEVQNLRKESQVFHALIETQANKTDQMMKVKDSRISELESKLTESELEQQRLQEVLNTTREEKERSASININAVRQLQDERSQSKKQLTELNKIRGKLERDLQESKERLLRLSSGQVAEDLTKLLKDDIQTMTDILEEQKKLTGQGVELTPETELCTVEAGLAAIKECGDDLKQECAKDTLIRDECKRLISRNKRLLEKLDTQPEATAGLEARTHVETENEALTANAFELLNDLARTRRVTVRSPIKEPRPSAPSVFEERQNRRNLKPVKSNFKMTTRSASKELQTSADDAKDTKSMIDLSQGQTPNTLQFQSRQKPQLSIHSSFNRPVHSDHKRKGMAVAGKQAVKRRKKTYAPKSTEETHTELVPAAMDHTLPRTDPPDHRPETLTRSMWSSDRVIHGAEEQGQEEDADKPGIFKNTVSVHHEHQSRQPEELRRIVPLITYGRQDRNGLEQDRGSSTQVDGHEFN
jgi:hypothetical protein